MSVNPTKSLYNVNCILVSLLFCTPAVFCLAGCGAVITRSEQQVRGEEVLVTINSMRTKKGLEALALNEKLMETARQRADRAAERGSLESDDNPLPGIIASGCYARFALTHLVRAASPDGVTRALTGDPLSKSKLLHPRLTHVGFGFSSSREGVFASMDLARLVEKIDLVEARKQLFTRIKKKRKGNSVEPLAENEQLAAMAQEIASKFMAESASSDALIAQAQKEVDGQTFALGRVTITFQVAGDVKTAVIPSMTSDPALAFVGLGLAQGNHPNHEAGSLAVAIFLAEPQTAHTSTREISKLPPPKAMPSQMSVPKGSLVDNAWLATLTGNHRKAAVYFKKAYAANKDSDLLYEAARAHARNGDTKAALATMKEYSLLVGGEEKEKANEMIDLIKKGKTIFTTSKKKKMSIESKRFFVIGQRLFEQQEWDGAIDAFQQAYTYSNHPDIIYNIGLTHIRAGRIGDALDFFGEYQKQVPEANSVDQARQFFAIGLELYQAGQFEAASENFAMSYAFAPFPELIYNLALCHKALGQNKDALRFFREFLDTDPPETDRAEAQKIIDQLSK